MTNTGINVCTASEMDREDAAEAHAYNRSFPPREYLHSGEPPGSGTYTRPKEESLGTTNRRRRRTTETARLYKARTRGGSKPVAYPTAKDGDSVQATVSYGHGIGDDGGSHDSHR